MIDRNDLEHLERCVALAEEAVENGDEPFGSLLVAGDGRVLFEDRNRVGTGDPTLHPEYAIAKWAVGNMAEEERRNATVYTSGEHCPMCSAAHGFAGLGRIVYASSSQQLGRWLTEVGAPPSTVRSLPIRDIVPGLAVEGPVDAFADRLRRLHERAQAKRR